MQVLLSQNQKTRWLYKNVKHFTRRQRRHYECIDLHGVKHADVEGVIDTFVMSLDNEGDPFWVVTGRSLAMIDIVRKRLDELGYTMNIDWQSQGGRYTACKKY